jgi:peptidoglycan-associated lipoprotein
MTILLILLAVMSGCSKKIVKSDPPPAPPLPELQGQSQSEPIVEKDLQAVQASLKTIHFDYDQYALSENAQKALQYNADILKRAENVRVLAEGHCDERGTAEYNLALGERRAQSARDYLVSLGISPRRLSTVSYGSELPVASGHNEAAWAQNRRVYFRVSK